MEDVSQPMPSYLIIYKRSTDNESDVTCRTNNLSVNLVLYLIKLIINTSNSPSGKKTTDLQQVYGDAKQKSVTKLYPRRVTCSHAADPFI